MGNIAMDSLHFAFRAVFILQPPKRKEGENSVFVLQADDVTNYGWNFLEHFPKRRLFIGTHIVYTPSIIELPKVNVNATTSRSSRLIDIWCLS